MLRKRWLLFVLVALLIASRPVSAHRPGWGEDGKVTEIENINTSFAFYRSLTAAPISSDEPIAVTGESTLAEQASAEAGTVDIYAFEGQAGQNLYAGINIPILPGLETYAVTLAIVGPGLERTDVAQLPIQPPDESLGALIVPSRTSPDFFEPFTQTNYWGRQEINLTLPTSGEYYLLVWNPHSQPGKYVLATGTAEVFGPGDIFRFPVWWVQVHLFFEHGPYLAGAAVAILLLLGSVLILRKRRRSALQ